VYGAERDIEWAFAGGQLYLLQCRAVTTSAGAATPVALTTSEVLAESLVRVPLLSNLPEPDRDAIARLFTERTFAPGETVTKEGADAAAFYLIESGTATVTVGGAFRRTLGAGDHFGEIALIDGRARSATVTADGELVCQGITLWDFQPLVQRNPTMAWTLLQTLAGMLRQAGETQSPT
jgi:CRP-like cAMP-binding protein